MKLSIKNISKTYPNGIEALKNVSLEIGNGMFGLLGPNGAGKSTLMRTIAALQDADNGSITELSIQNNGKKWLNHCSIKRTCGKQKIKNWGLIPVE